MKYIREHLSAKLFIANLIVIFVGVLILGITIQVAIPAAFNHHMIGMGSMMGMGTSAPGMGTLFDRYRLSLYEALRIAVTASVLVALLVSLFLNRRIVVPIQTLSDASQHIAEGHYEKRVQVEGADEIAQLAARFNQMAAQLAQVESMRRQLIGDVTHELRTPLTSIKGYMEGLVDGVLPATPDTFNQIHHEADRLSHLVDDLQELSRVESKAYSLDFRPVLVSNLVQSGIKRVSPQATAKGIRWGLHIPNDLPAIRADQDRILQVLLNLLANAIQYTPENGEVTISAALHSDVVYISVKDTGIGIPAEHLPNLFTRFYRVDKSRSRSAGGGSGIGLTIAKHIVEAHGGRIWVESPGEGQGCTFTFSVMPAA